METEYFIKKPKTGDIVKVYIRNAVTFGIIKRTIFRNKIRKQKIRVDGKFVKDKKGKYITELIEIMREIIVLRKTNKKYDLLDCDFCLTMSKVEFE